jgi:hypothetical protein
MPKGQQLAVASTELPRENIDLHMDSEPPAVRRRTLSTDGMLETPSPELEENQNELESEDGSGKDTLYTIYRA